MSNKKPKTITSGADTFELVDEIPAGYLIWNIGKNMVKGYLPLCRLCKEQPYPGCRKIEPDTLKAIKCAGAQTILFVAGYGDNTLADMERYVSQHNAEIDSGEARRVALYRKAIPFMKRIKGVENLVN